MLELNPLARTPSAQDISSQVWTSVVTAIFLLISSAVRTSWLGSLGFEIRPVISTTIHDKGRSYTHPFKAFLDTSPHQILQIRISSISPISKMDSGTFNGQFMDTAMPRGTSKIGTGFQFPTTVTNLEAVAPWHTQSLSRQPSNAAWKTKPKQNKKQGRRCTRRSHCVQCPHHIPRVSKIQQHLNAMGIFTVVFAKQILPYLKQRSTALQNCQREPLVGRTCHSLMKSLPIVIQTASSV